MNKEDRLTLLKRICYRLNQSIACDGIQTFKSEKRSYEHLSETGEILGIKPRDYASGGKHNEEGAGYFIRGDQE